MKLLSIIIFLIGLSFLIGTILNSPSNHAYSQSIYVDENDLQKPAPKILSFKQIDEKSIKVIWKLDKHPEGKELKFFNVEITIGLDVDCCGPGTNEETFEEANSEPIPAEIREFVISNHKGQPLKDKTEYCVEIEAQWPGPNLDSQPSCLIFDNSFKVTPSNNDENFILFAIGIIIAVVITFIVIRIRSRISI